MSDSDDTDILLLIPPDFFFVAPSPSPVSSPSTITPPSPIPRSFFKRERISLTEKQARKSLTELNSQLRIIERRLSLVESQYSESMDDEHSSNWYDLESYTSANHSYQPHTSMDKSTDWRSMNVQELLQAAARDRKSVSQQQDSSMAHTWGPSNKEYYLSSNQRVRRLDSRRETASQARASLQERNVSSDDEEQWRERRATSLPPTPSSHHPYPPLPQKYPHSKPPSGYKKDANKPNRREVIPPERNERVERNIGTGRGQETPVDRRKGVALVTGPDNQSDWTGHTSGVDEYSRKEEVRTARGPENRSEWVERRPGGDEQIRAGDHRASHGAEGAESFASNTSTLDGTLGVSALIPSLSSLGLNASFIQPGSLDMTKESSSSVGGGSGGGLSLAQVEKLLHDMHKTQAEMERSIRRGMEQMGRGENEEVARPQGSKKQPEIERQVDLEGGDHREKSIELPGMEKRDLELSQGEITHGKEQKQYEWVMDGKVRGPHCGSNVAPVSIVVEGTGMPNKNQSTKGGGDAYQETEERLLSERGRVEGQSCREGFSIFRSKSDESLSGRQGKSAKDNNAHKYLGIESSDDSFVSSGPVTASRITYLGDNLGSVPNLGLGVREMFAGSDKHKSPVKEPPCVKKNMSTLGSVKLVDAVVRVTEDNSVAESRPTGSKITIVKTKFDSPQPSAKEGDSQTWPLNHHNKEEKDQNQLYAGISQPGGSPRANHFHSPVIVKQVSYSPQKEVSSPRSSQDQWDGSSRDTRRKLHFDEQARYAEFHYVHPAGGIAESPSNIPPVPTNTAVRPPVKDGGECGSLNFRGKNKEGECGVEGRSQRHQENIPQTMGPVMVVGGDGMKKGRKGEREELRRQDENVRLDDRPRITGREVIQEDRNWDQEGQRKRHENVETIREGRPRRDVREGDRLMARDYEHRSLDDGIGQGRSARFRDSGYDDSGSRNMYRGPPASGCRLFSASDIWVPPLTSNVAEAAAASEGALVLRRKLEEERFRREHCERVIEEVGRRALEAQERLAVSQGLSKAKDVALGKFREAWEEAVSGWKREGEARKGLEEEVERYRERVNAEITYRDKRLKQLESELMKLGDESFSLREELRKGQRETAEITARLSAMLEVATKEVANCRKESESASLREARAQDEASKARDAAKEAKKKLEEANKRADSLESEKITMKQELETLQGKLRDGNSRISTLESRLADAEVSVDRARQTEKSACEDLVQAKQEWEKERTKLKEFYQSQVEELVRTKVNEFQGQLDAVEHSLRKEAELREEQAKKLGEERLRLLNEKNSQEVNLLEQKHEEELALWSLRLKRAIAEVDSLKAQVAKHNAQKSHLAKGLHTLMQAQLKQGLRLIASGGEADHESIQSPPKRVEKQTPLEASWREVMASLNFPGSAEFVPEKDHIPKKDTDYLKEKDFQNVSKEKTEKDMTASSNKAPSISNNDLKKYIHMKRR